MASLPGTTSVAGSTMGEGVYGSADIPSLPPMDNTTTATTVSGKGKKGGTGGKGKAAPRARRGKDLQNVGK